MTKIVRGFISFEFSWPEIPTENLTLNELHTDKIGQYRKYEIKDHLFI